MKKNTIRRILSVLVMTIVVTSMVFPAPANAHTPNTYSTYDMALYERGNRVGARYTDPDFDIAKNKSILATNYANNTFTPAMAVDGDTTSGGNCWMAGPITPPNTAWIVIDLGAYYYFDRWVVKHFSPYGTGNVSKSYKLEYLSDNGNYWLPVDQISNNTSKITDRTISSQVIARIIRVLFTEGCPNDNKVKIAEIGIYNSKGYTPFSGDILTTESSTPDHSAINFSYNVAIEADGKPGGDNPECVLTTTMDKWKTGYGQVTVLRVKNAWWEMGQGAANFAHSVLNFPYNYNLTDYRNLTKFYCNALCYSSWKYNGVDSVSLDSDLFIPGLGPLTVSDLRDDNSVYVAYERNNGLANSNVYWGN